MTQAAGIEPATARMGRLDLTRVTATDYGATARHVAGYTAFSSTLESSQVDWSAPECWRRMVITTALKRKVVPPVDVIRAGN